MNEINPTVFDAALAEGHTRICECLDIGESYKFSVDATEEAWELIYRSIAEGVGYPGIHLHAHLFSFKAKKTEPSPLGSRGVVEVKRIAHPDGPTRLWGEPIRPGLPIDLCIRLASGDPETITFEAPATVWNNLISMTGDKFPVYGCNPHPTLVEAHHLKPDGEGGMVSGQIKLQIEP